MNTEYAAVNTHLKEKTKHGDIFFPLQYYHTELNSRYPAIDIHWHPEMEFTKIIQGSALYSVNFQEFVVKEGDFICISPHLLHTARIFPSENMKSDTYVFHLNMLGNSSADICDLKYFSPIMKQELNLPYCIRPSDSIYPQLNKLFDGLSTCFSNQAPLFELQVKGYLFHLLCLLISCSDRETSPQLREQQVRLKQVFQYVQNNFANPVNIDHVAKLCCVTPSHFMHYFKEKTGSTFNQYLNQYRLGQAALMLKKGISISETAYSCGFNNLPYFYKRFQDYYQMTPKEFQKKERIQE